MKKVFATILAFLYLATSSGAVITIHYCMGEVVPEHRIKKDKCSRCGMKAAKGCCEDKVKVLKIQDSHSGVLLTATPAVPFVLVQTADSFFQPLFTGLPSLGAIQNNSPPGSSGALLCILYCVFRL